jgi:uncharacterized hydantoinase/oxoprolinase family protein
MKLLDEYEFYDLGFKPKKALATVVAKRMVEAYKDDEEMLLLVMTKGLIDAWNHEAEGYTEYQQDMEWFNDWDKEEE